MKFGYYYYNIFHFLQFVLKQFEKNPKLIYHCDFSPEKLPYLIENNSRVAVEALLQLKSSPQIGK